MATVHRERGISFRVHSKDHAPAHVHACIGGAYAKIALPSGGETANVMRIVGKMKVADLVRAVGIVQDKSDLMWEGWNKFHGR